MQRWRPSAQVSHLRPRRLRLAALTVTRRLSVMAAAALTVTSGTIVHTMATTGIISGTIIGLMRMQPTVRYIGFIDHFTLTQGISPGTEFIGRSIGLMHSQCTGHFIDHLRLQRIGHSIDRWRSGADASRALPACFA